MVPGGTGAESDAAKLQHSVVGLRWKRVRNPAMVSEVAQGVPGGEGFAGRQCLDTFINS